jgi:hypothetical protein
MHELITLSDLALVHLSRDHALSMHRDSYW